MVISSPMDFGSFVRWGGLLTLSLVTHYYLLSSVDLAAKPIVQPTQQIKISLVALAAPKSVPNLAPPTPSKPVVQKIDPKTEIAPPPAPQATVPKVALSQTAKTAWHKPVASEKPAEPNLEKAVASLPDVKPEKTDPAKPVPTPRLVLRKPTLPEPKPETKVARLTPEEPVVTPTVEQEAPVEVAKVEPRQIEQASKAPAAPEIDTANTGKQASTASTLHKAKLSSLPATVCLIKRH